jgi:hypothetical protein
MGKTQTAIEYAYRYGAEYAAVLWAKAYPQEALLADFVALAALLDLPQKEAQDQTLIIAAVRQWLETHSEWLLIFDNADDLSLVRPFLPQRRGGHVVLTTRASALGGLAQRIEIDQLTATEGAQFLLLRTGLLAPEETLESVAAAERTAAEAIARALDGLPLALDQAGAYIEETSCGLSEYLARYRLHEVALLKRRGLSVVDHHPDPVATTWALSFEQIETANLAAAELLRFCAFLSAEAIPEELLAAGAPELGPVLAPVAADSFALDTAVAEILKYSLLHRDPQSKTLTMHRLVQTVLQHTLEEMARRQWAERAVRSIHRAFPAVEFSTWARCERLLPHALACATLMEHWKLLFPEGASVLNQAGYFLHERARFGEAEPLYQRALAIAEQTLGPDHRRVATVLENYAKLLYQLHKTDEATQHRTRAAAIHARRANRPPAFSHLD